MTEKERPMSEQESLALITEMIQKAKSHFHENGTSAILWGSVIGFCGIFSFLRHLFDWNTGYFDIWYLALIALIPQLFIAIRERKRRVVKTHMEAAIDAVWTVYGISIFALMFYLNVVPSISEGFFAADNTELLIKNLATGEARHWKAITFSQSSLLLILYAIPTMVTGIAKKFKPMIIGGIICYVFFIASCFTTVTYDWLLNGLAGIFNWLIPGLILRNKYNKAKLAQHV